jgi:hypothetical protein
MGGAYIEVQNMDLPLRNGEEAIALRLALPPGTYIVIGKTVLTNADASQQDATARLTWFDGESEVDRAEIRIAAADGASAGTQVVSLLGWVILTDASPDRIVDLRAQTQIGSARESALVAVAVDTFQLNGNVMP